MVVPVAKSLGISSRHILWLLFLPNPLAVISANPLAGFFHEPQSVWVLLPSVDAYVLVILCFLAQPILLEGGLGARR